MNRDGKTWLGKPEQEYNRTEQGGYITKHRKYYKLDSAPFN